ncbi:MULTISPECIES: serine hydrolase domain-containing protein [unclassified Sphingopyxis]|uniref:serine hydrolase domain-containing protein n=1 Tax=unclassified Sphingopyxis TaxID=2614943 RepID=UPI000736E935|nr:MULTISPECIES: serine hydrolase domain-containing protein [unclassified Sphingopyxis]KTE29759.1 serine hydrolase [Sphingopyxis sp. HIX]KTE79665.1 serine hydrolase [Sphingopyxis sp. HXXIV]
MRASLIALCLLAAAPAAFAFPAAAQTAQAQAVTIDKARIDAALAQMISSDRAGGVSALVWQDGKEVYYGSAGFADRAADRPMARDTIAQIYSMTKPVTGVALMQLWEAGKFRLDDPLAKYLPEYANMRVYTGKDETGQPRYVAAERPITVRDIMRHTAGFAYGAGPTPAHDAYVAAAPLALDIDLAEASRRLATVPLLYQPGSQWEYSIAVDVQAALVEKLSGQPFADYVRTHIFEPLKMTETAWRQPDTRLPRFAAMYEKKGGKMVQQEAAIARVLNFQDHKLTPGGFGLASTLDDYQRFARMLLNGGALDGVRILEPSTVKLMASDQLDPAIRERSWLPSKGHVGFGFDFAVRKGQPLTAGESRGATGEFFWDGMASTLFWVDPANKLTAVFFVQTLPYDGTLHRDFRAAVYGPGYKGPPGD